MTLENRIQKEPTLFSRVKTTISNLYYNTKVRTATLLMTALLSLPFAGGCSSYQRNQASSNAPLETEIVDALKKTQPVKLEKESKIYQRVFEINKDEINQYEWTLKEITPKGDIRRVSFSRHKTKDLPYSTDRFVRRKTEKPTESDAGDFVYEYIRIEGDRYFRVRSNVAPSPTENILRMDPEKENRIFSKEAFNKQRDEFFYNQDQEDDWIPRLMLENTDFKSNAGEFSVSFKYTGETRAGNDLANFKAVNRKGETIYEENGIVVPDGLIIRPLLSKKSTLPTEYNALQISHKNWRRCFLFDIPTTGDYNYNCHDMILYFDAQSRPNDPEVRLVGNDGCSLDGPHGKPDVTCKVNQYSKGYGRNGIFSTILQQLYQRLSKPVTMMHKTTGLESKTQN